MGDRIIIDHVRPASSPSLGHYLFNCVSEWTLEEISTRPMLLRVRFQIDVVVVADRPIIAALLAIQSTNHLFRWGLIFSAQNETVPDDHNIHNTLKSQTPLYTCSYNVIVVEWIFLDIVVVPNASFGFPIVVGLVVVYLLENGGSSRPGLVATV